MEASSKLKLKYFHENQKDPSRSIRALTKIYGNFKFLHFGTYQGSLQHVNYGVFMKIERTLQGL